MSSKEDKSFFEKYNMKWVLTITVITFILAVIFSVVAENLVDKLEVALAFLILLFIIIIGIIFDIIGIAVTKAEEKPFHSMASRKINEAKVAISLIRNAGPVSNFCNDVVGDISGIISGAVGASIIFKLTTEYGFKDSALLNTLIAASTAALTVGGKALGKSYALIHYEKIVMGLAKMIDKIERTFNVKFFKNNKKKNKEKFNKEKHNGNKTK